MRIFRKFYKIESELINIDSFPATKLFLRAAHLNDSSTSPRVSSPCRLGHALLVSNRHYTKY